MRKCLIKDLLRIFSSTDIYHRRCGPRRQRRWSMVPQVEGGISVGDWRNRPISSSGLALQASLNHAGTCRTTPRGSQTRAPQHTAQRPSRGPLISLDSMLPHLTTFSNRLREYALRMANAPHHGSTLGSSFLYLLLREKIPTVSDPLRGPGLQAKMVSTILSEPPKTL